MAPAIKQTRQQRPRVRADGESVAAIESSRWKTRDKRKSSGALRRGQWDAQAQPKDNTTSDSTSNEGLPFLRGLLFQSEESGYHHLKALSARTCWPGKFGSNTCNKVWDTLLNIARNKWKKRLWLIIWRKLRANDSYPITSLRDAVLRPVAIERNGMRRGKQTKQKTGEPTQSVRIIAYMSRRRRWRFSRCCWWLNFPPHHPPSSESVPTSNGRRPLNGGGKRRSLYNVAYPFWTPMETFFVCFLFFLWHRLTFRTLSMAEWPIVNTSYPA